MAKEVKNRPAYMWYPADFKNGTKYFNFMERAIFRELLDAQWDDGYIPDDPLILARLCGIDANAFKTHWENVRTKFKELEPGKLINERMERDRAKLDEKSEKAAESARARWGGKSSKSTSKKDKKANDMRTHSEGNAKAMHFRAENEYENEVEIKEIEKRVTKGKEKEKLAENVTMTNDEYSSLIERFGEVAASWMIQKLNNYKISKGKKYKSDYRAILSWVADEYQKQVKNGKERLDQGQQEYLVHRTDV